jgi:hypothetical protein
MASRADKLAACQKVTTKLISKACCALALTLLAGSAQAQFTYTGGILNTNQIYDGLGVDSALNPDTIGSTSSDDYFGNASGKTGSLTVLSGTLTIINDDFKVGAGGTGVVILGQNATLNVQATGQWGPAIGQNSAGTLIVSNNATVNFNIAGSNEQRLTFGNNNNVGEVDVLGGAINVTNGTGTSDDLRQFGIGASGGTGTVNLNAGTITDNMPLPFVLGGNYSGMNTTPTFIQSTPVSRLNIINGSFVMTGICPLTDANKATFTIGNNSTVVFEDGTGSLSLANWASSDYELLVDTGSIRIGLPGQPSSLADMSKFNYSSNSVTGQGILTVIPFVLPPTISDQMQSITAIVGQPAHMSVSTTNISGTTPFTYQWQLNGINIDQLADRANFSGAHSNTLTILNVALADVGYYELLVTNVAGVGYSSGAYLATYAIQSSPSLVGQWLTNSSLADVSGYSAAGTHDAYVVGGTSVTDDLGNPVSTNYNYVFTNDVPFGKLGKSLCLGATTNDTGLAISNSSTSDPGYINTFDDAINTAFTVMCWAKGMPSGWYPFVSKFGETEAGWQLRDDGSSNACFTMRNGSVGTTILGQSVWGNSDDMGAIGLPSNDGKWHFYAGTFDGVTGIRTLYVDGLPAAQETNNVPYSLAAVEHLCIGAKDNAGTVGSFFTGEIYDVRVYNYALTQSQVDDVQGVIVPTISGQPKSITAFVGRTAQFSTVVAGTAPIGYQWQLNGTNVNLLSDGTNFSGANSNILTILNVAPSDVGSYQLIVTNLYGTTESSSATLTVEYTLLLGEWLAGSTNLNDVSDYSPAGTHDGYDVVGNGDYQFVKDVPPGHSGQSLYLSAGDTAIAISNSATSDGSYTNTFDQETFTVAFWAKGNQGKDYSQWVQWVSKDGYNNNGGNNDGVGWSIGTEGWSDAFYFEMDGIDQGGIQYTLGDGLWGNGILETSPGNLPGNNNTWHHYAVTYSATTGFRRMYFDGALVAEQTHDANNSLATAEHLLIGGQERTGNNFVAFTKGWMYDVRFYNYDLTSAQIQVFTNMPNPAVMTQPMDVISYVGETAQISATASGSAPLTNQWQLNGVNLVDGTYGGVTITGSKTSVLTIANVKSSFQGTYHLVVSNPNGQQTSDDANLTVLATVPPPAANLVGEWLAGPTSLADSSGYSPAGTHDGYGVTGSGTRAYNFVFTNDVPPNATGKSLLFQGNTAIAITNSSTLDASYINTYDDTLSSAMTVAFWAKGLPGGWNPWVSKYGESEAGWELRLGGNGTEPCWTVRDNNAGSYTLGNGPSWSMAGDQDDMHANIGINDNNWHFYAGTFDVTTGIRNLYVDGTLAAQEINNQAYAVASAEHLAIGGKDQPSGNNFGNYFTGEIYGVRIYNTALTAGQVNYLLATPPPATVTPPPPAVPLFSGNPAITTGPNGQQQLVLTWSTGALLQATNVSGPWTLFGGTGATSPYTNNISTAPQMFFRLRNP